MSALVPLGAAAEGGLAGLESARGANQQKFANEVTAARLLLQQQNQQRLAQMSKPNKGNDFRFGQASLKALFPDLPAEAHAELMNAGPDTVLGLAQRLIGFGNLGVRSEDVESKVLKRIADATRATQQLNHDQRKLADQMLDGLLTEVEIAEDNKLFDPGLLNRLKAFMNAMGMEQFTPEELQDPRVINATLRALKAQVSAEQIQKVLPGVTPQDVPRIERNPPRRAPQRAPKANPDFDLD